MRKDVGNRDESRHARVNPLQVLLPRAEAARACGKIPPQHSQIGVRDERRCDNADEQRSSENERKGGEVETDDLLATVRYKQDGQPLSAEDEPPSRNTPSIVRCAAE
jgi:hypothetical protein